MRSSIVILMGAAACSSTPAPPIPEPGDLSLTITSPVTAELDAATTPMIAVAGTATTTNPDFGTLHVWVDGNPVDLDASGGFTAMVTPAIGINHIQVDATDEVGSTAQEDVDVMWGLAYLPPEAGTTGFAITDALDLSLGQQFFDNRRLGTTLDRSTTPVVAHDLASALESILWNIDLASLIGGGLTVGTGSSQLNVQIPSAIPNEIVVDATIVDAGDNGIDLAIDLDSVFLATTGSFTTAGKTLVVQGGLSADMHATAHMAVGLNADGTLNVTASDVVATVDRLSPEFTGGDGETLNGFITVGNNDFRVLVENLISQQLIPTFTDKIPPLLEQLLGATDSLLNNVMFTLDSTLGTPVTLVLNGKVASLDVSSGPAVGAVPGRITVRQTVAVTTGAAAPIHPESRGALRITDQPQLPDGDAGALEIALSEDFLNGLLHSLWNSGLLDGETMIGGLTAQVSAKLAPVAIPTPDGTTCVVGGARCDLVLQLGQVELTLPDTQQTFAINATAGARIVVDGVTISLVIADTPDVVVWEITPMAKDEVIDAAAVGGIVKTLVWPKLFGAIGDNLHITLPIPDLAALGLDALSPNLADAKLDLVVRPHAAIQSGFLGLGADLQLTTPM